MEISFKNKSFSITPTIRFGSKGKPGDIISDYFEHPVKVIEQINQAMEPFPKLNLSKPQKMQNYK